MPLRNGVFAILLYLGTKIVESYQANMLAVFANPIVLLVLSAFSIGYFFLSVMLSLVASKSRTFAIAFAMFAWSLFCLYCFFLPVSNWERRLEMASAFFVVSSTTSFIVLQKRHSNRSWQFGIFAFFLWILHISLLISTVNDRSRLQQFKRAIQSFDGQISWNPKGVWEISIRRPLLSNNEANQLKNVISKVGAIDLSLLGVNVSEESLESISTLENLKRLHVAKVSCNDTLKAKISQSRSDLEITESP